MRVYQDATPRIKDAVKKFKVLNPAHVTVTVSGSMMHNSDGKYSRFNGSCYELAEIITNGAGRKGGVPRPFIKNAMSLLKYDKRWRKASADVFKKNTRVVGKKGLYVDWHSCGGWLAAFARQMMVSEMLGLVPIEPITDKKKKKAGYNSTTAVASGQLADAITFSVWG